MRDRTYCLYGLTVRTSVVLPGARPVPTGAPPALELRHADRDEIAARRGPGRPRPVWRGRSPDGEALQVVDGPPGERVFLHPGGTFHLGDGVLSFAPEPGPDELAWMRALLGSVLVSISLLRGYEALRASAVEIGGRVVAFAGGSERARSGLAAELVRRGHPLVCDGALALTRDGNELRAEPGPPHLNLALEPGRATTVS